MPGKINRIGIVGMGPVGSILATHLNEAGMDVAICDLDKLKMNLVKTEGIILEGVMSKKTFFKIGCTNQVRIFRVGKKSILS